MEQWSALRGRAHALAELHGVTPPPRVTQTGGSSWRYGDTAHPNFGEEVLPQLLADPSNLKTGGASGLLREEDDDEGQEVWTFVQRVTKPQAPLWLWTKQHGPGRDKKLLPLNVKASGRCVLFREAAVCFDESPVPDVRIFGDTPSAMQ